MKVKTAMAIRISEGMIVQMISIRVLPWICGPSASSGVPRRRRKRITKRTSADSTATNTTAQTATTAQ